MDAGKRRVILLLWLVGVGNNQGTGTSSPTTQTRTGQYCRVSTTQWAVGVTWVSVSHETVRWLIQRLVMNIHELHYFIVDGKRSSLPSRGGRVLISCLLELNSLAHPSLRPPGFDLPSQLWSMLNWFQIGQGQCCRFDELRRWRNAAWSDRDGEPWCGVMPWDADSREIALEILLIILMTVLEIHIISIQ